MTIDIYVEVFIGIIGMIISLAALFAGLGYYRQGKKQEVLDGQQDEINAVTILQNDVNGLRKQVKELTEKVDLLTKENEAKDKKLSEWMLVFQGRDPDMKAFMEMMKTYISTNTPMLETIKTKTIPTIERMEKYLDKQTF